MHFLGSPLTNFKEVIDVCVSKESELVRNKFGLALNVLMDDQKSYEILVQENETHRIKQDEEIITDLATQDDFKWLYKNKFAQQSAPGRIYYDRFLVRGKMKGCCYCSYEEPTELDHFLPLSKYSRYSIFPNNLIPVCHRCNKLKAAFSSNDSTDNMIHPFLENFDSIDWLQSKVIFEGNTPVAQFSIYNEGLGNLTIQRIQNQFNKVRLFDRYSYQASREFASRESKFREVSELRGPEGLKEDLLEEAKSRSIVHRNSWQTALYRELAKNEIFVEMKWEI